MAKRHTNLSKPFYSGPDLKMKIVTNVYGIEGIVDGLRGMNKGAQKLIQKVARKNLRPALKMVKSLTPVGTKPMKNRTIRLNKSWVIDAGKKYAYSTGMFIKRRKGSRAFHLNLVDGGVNHKWKNGTITRVPGVHMLDRTFESLGRSIADGISSDLVDELTNQWDRTGSSTATFDDISRQIDDMWSGQVSANEDENSFLSAWESGTL